jgi:cell division protein FtsB
MSDDTQKITKIEQQVAQLIKQNQELDRRVQFLERENNRRKSETSQIAAAVNKRG